MAHQRTPKSNMKVGDDKRRVCSCEGCNKAFDREVDMQKCWIAHYMRGEIE